MYTHICTYPSPAQYSRQVIFAPQRKHSHRRRRSDLKFIQNRQNPSCCTISPTYQYPEIADVAVHFQPETSTINKIKTSVMLDIVRASLSKKWPHIYNTLYYRSYKNTSTTGRACTVCSWYLFQGWNVLSSWLHFDGTRQFIRLFLYLQKWVWLASLQLEQLLLWLHGRGLSFTLKPWANRGIPAMYMYEWFSLSFIPGAYMKQTSPPYKPATVRLTALIYQEVAVRAANAFNLSHLSSRSVSCQH